jgi:hypothetical protein
VQTDMTKLISVFHSCFANAFNNISKKVSVLFSMLTVYLNLKIKKGEKKNFCETKCMYMCCCQITRIYDIKNLVHSMGKIFATKPQIFIPLNRSYPLNCFIRLMCSMCAQVHLFAQTGLPSREYVFGKT